MPAATPAPSPCPQPPLLLLHAGSHPSSFCASPSSSRSALCRREGVAEPLAPLQTRLTAGRRCGLGSPRWQERRRRPWLRVSDRPRLQELRGGPGTKQQQRRAGAVVSARRGSGVGRAESPSMLAGSCRAAAVVAGFGAGGPHAAGRRKETEGRRIFASCATQNRCCVCLPCWRMFFTVRYLFWVWVLLCQSCWRRLSSNRKVTWSVYATQAMGLR